MTVKAKFQRVLEDTPYAEITEQEFLNLISKGSSWTVTDERVKPYSINTGGSNVDEYVKEALWHLDPEKYEEIRGYTKQPNIKRAYHTLLRYGYPAHYRKFSPGVERCYQETLQELSFKFKRVRPVKLSTALEKLNMVGSAGILHPGKKKGEVLDLAYNYCSERIEELKRGEQIEHIPYKLGLRGHLSKKDQVKTRPIWGGAVETNLFEAMLFSPFYQQIFESLTLRELFLTGDRTIERLHNYLNDIVYEDKTFVNTDVSGFDALRCRFLIKDIFRMLKSSIDFGEEYEKDLFDHLVEDFIFTKLALPSGVVVKKHLGVPSGSYLTLLVNSLCNFVIQTLSCKIAGVNPLSKRVLGDDFCFYMDKLPHRMFDQVIKSISSAALELFAVTIKPEKVVITNVPTKRKFIGYQMKQGQLHREDDELLMSALYPEAHVRSLRTSFTRLFGYYLIGGCNSHVYRSLFSCFLSGYKRKLDEFGRELINTQILNKGSLRVFKHVYNIDPERFAGMSVDDFRSLPHFKIPYFLTFSLSL